MGRYDPLLINHFGFFGVMPKGCKTPVALTSLQFQIILLFRKKQNFRYLHRLFQTSLLPNFLWGSQKSNVR